MIWGERFPELRKFGECGIACLFLGNVTANLCTRRSCGSGNPCDYTVCYSQTSLPTVEPFLHHTSYLSSEIPFGNTDPEGLMFARSIHSGSVFRLVWFCYKKSSSPIVGLSLGPKKALSLRLVFLGSPHLGCLWGGHENQTKLIWGPKEDLEGGRLWTDVLTSPSLPPQDGFPIRIKAVHVVNEPRIFKGIFAIIKPFLKEKIANRVSDDSVDLILFFFAPLFVTSVNFS